jgi:predicted transcriptional regulator
MERYRRLMKVSDAVRSANSFGLFRTGNGLERIQRELAHFPTIPEGVRAQKAGRIIEHVEKIEARLEDEHSDVSLAQNVKGRSRRGLVVSCALLAAQIATAVVTVLKPWFTPEIIEKYHPTTIAGLAILALAAFPIRDFLFAYRFEKLKERIGGVLQEVKHDMRKELDKKVN